MNVSWTELNRSLVGSCWELLGISHSSHYLRARIGCRFSQPKSGHFIIAPGNVPYATQHPKLKTLYTSNPLRRKASWNKTELFKMETQQWPGRKGEDPQRTVMWENARDRRRNKILSGELLFQKLKNVDNKTEKHKRWGGKEKKKNPKQSFGILQGPWSRKEKDKGSSITRETEVKGRGWNWGEWEDCCFKLEFGTIGADRNSSGQM